jgi:4-alpha-glucanotransferase
MFGSNDTFRNLCERAKEHNIRVILDGVFSHTGSDSIYFNKEGNYDSLGAYQSKESPYYSWYRFSNYPDSYESWWGIGTLPNVEESDPSYQEFIINAEDSVIRYWMKMGASGWRLDVADELPDPFIKQIRQVMKSVNPESILIGEVWEDASNKISYSEKRTFLMGELHQFLMSIYENYPREVFFSTMNLVGSHDVARILTLLGDGVSGEHLNESDKEKERLAPKQRKMGIDRLKTLTLVQMTFPGVPCIYYGDEAGMEGYSDPYNRGPYPWGKEDNELQAWYKKIIGLRNKYIALQGGDWLPLFAQGDVYGYMRSKENEWLAVIINRNTKSEVNIDVGLTPGNWQDLLDKNRKYVVDSDKTKIEIPPLGKILLLRSDID